MTAEVKVIEKVMEFEVLKRVQTLFAPSMPSSSDFPIILLNQPNEKLINANNELS